jgi:integrase/recombinase XerD
MLELYFKYPKVLRRLRSGAFGEDMDRIAAHFFELGYKRGSAKSYINRLARVSAFAARDGAGTTISHEMIDRFVQNLATAAPRIATRTAIAHARRLAPRCFSAPPRRTASDPDQLLLAQYLEHLHRVRGVAPKTCEGLLTVARRILAWYHGHLPDWPLAAMTGEHVLDLVEHLLSLSANAYTRSSTATHIRTFLRFLQWSGLNSEELARFVPRTPCWRLAHIPPRLAWDDLRHAIDAIDATTPSGMRDRAILLLLATTGLRNKELRLLEFQHIRWRAAEVVVCHAKSRRDRVLPLVQEAGAALADYVLHARPKTDSRRVFLSHVPPVRPFRYSSTISRIVRSRLTQGGIPLPRVAGAHLIRHSLATQMVRERRPINEVADLLGHRSIDTTAIYVKVALPQLADVALPFPGGVS